MLNHFFRDTVGYDLGHAGHSLGMGIQDLAIGAQKSRDANTGKTFSSPLCPGGLQLRSDGSTGLANGLGYSDPGAEVNATGSYQMTGKDKLNRIIKYGSWGVAGLAWLKFIKDPSLNHLLGAVGMTLASAAISKKMDRNLETRMEANDRGISEKDMKAEKKSEKRMQKDNKKQEKKLDHSSIDKRKNQDGSTTYMINYDKHDKQNGGLFYGGVQVDKNGTPIQKMRVTYDKDHKVTGAVISGYDKNGRQQKGTRYTAQQMEQKYPGFNKTISERNAKILGKSKTREKFRQPARTQTMQRIRMPAAPRLRTL